jgi:hypothetical protein
MDKEVIRMGSLGPRGTWFRLLDERSSIGKAVTRVHDPMGGRARIELWGLPATMTDHLGCRFAVDT